MDCLIFEFQTSASIHLVGLSDLNSNNYRVILNAKVSPTLISDSSAEDEDIVDNFRPYNIISELKQQQKHLSESEITEIIVKYKSGIATTVLAEEYGCHKATIRRALQRNGIKITKQPVANRIDTSRVIIMYEEKHTIAEIARYFGVSESAIRRRLIENNIPLRSRWDYRKP